jgi:hypothetical protein
MGKVRKGTLVAAAGCILLGCLVLAAPAGATSGWWHLSSNVLPAYLPPEGEGTIVLGASNLGDAAISGASEPVTISDQLPAGLTATGISAQAGIFSDWGPVECVQPAGPCTYTGSLPPYEELEVRIAVKAKPGAASGETNRMTLSGGGLPTIARSRPVPIDGTPAGFGIEPESFELTPEAEGGLPETQAGAHPFQVTTSFELNQTSEPNAPPAQAKDLRFLLPPGFVGNPKPFPQCSSAVFGKAVSDENECPPDTVVGVAQVTLDAQFFGQAESLAFPLFNLQPSIGEPARFGFLALGIPVLLDTSVRTGGDYGVTVSVDNISQIPNFIGSQVTLWGIPGDPRHDNARDWGCLGVFAGSKPCHPLGVLKPPPFISLPTSCGNSVSEPFSATMEAESWVTQKANSTSVYSTSPYRLHEPGGAPLAIDGCNRLNFEPKITVAPSGQAGSTPTGLTVGIHVPQESIFIPAGLAESAVKDTTVTLPEGVALNPSAADGLETCSEAQVALSQDVVPSCPEASKVGLVRIKTPLLPNELTGEVYLAAQDQNPFGSLVALYLVARDPVSGTLIKVAGEVAPNPVTGQLVSTFNDTPELPFEELALEFFGGSRAPLVSPALCGVHTTTASISPWSGEAPATPSSTYETTTGPNGSPCSNPLPFNPTLTAGTTSIQAGGFSPFTVTMSREDGEQHLQGIALKMPLGMSGTLSTVKLCGEEQADAGTCGPESQIGETIVSVGVGGDPYTVKGGKVYITGPYKGAPFGLSIVNPAVAGPYNLGKVVVRAKIEVNPETAALTITTDNEGPYKIPTILDGIPLQIRHVNVDINRPGFTFNATNCNPLAVTGSLTSTEGATSALSVPYQVTNCAVLAFKPKLEASTSGKTSRTDGASLTVKLSYPAGPYDANIAKVKVELPKALPSELRTLQKACTAAVFEANPANCPPQSIVGYGTATTPVLPVPLSGPAYFVSHGGEAFPSLVIVLQGYGVTVHLVGSTFISSSGITSSTFKAVPDVPVGTFELTLPEGPYSALAATGNLCNDNLAMPTEFIGQNGALIDTSTKIAVTGCKPAIGVVHHAVSGRKATIAVSVPSAGTLLATGAGLSRGTAKAGAAGTVTVGLTLSSKEQRFLRHHPGRRLKVNVTLLFTPTQGGTLSNHVTLLMR